MKEYTRYGLLNLKKEKLVKTILAIQETMLNNEVDNDDLKALQEIVNLFNELVAKQLN